MENKVYILSVIFYVSWFGTRLVPILITKDIFSFPSPNSKLSSAILIADQKVTNHKMDCS